MKLNIYKYLFLITAILLIGALFLNNSKHNISFIATENEIKFNNYLIETKQTLPRLFIQSPLEQGVNAKYYYSVFNDLKSNQEFIRVDKKIIQTGTVWFDNVTAFYVYNPSANKYKRVLVSSEKQNNSRFPQTQIVNPDDLTIKFYYDVSRPNQCYGYDCRSYWADFYKWENKENKFNLVNKDFKNFFKDLLKQYDEMNRNGCILGDQEDKGIKSLEDVYNYNKTDYCRGSTREELNKFFQVKKEVSEVLK